MVSDDDEVKKCSKCKKIRPLLASFNKDGRGGWDNRCKTCEKSRQSKINRANRKRYADSDNPGRICKCCGLIGVKTVKCMQCGATRKMTWRERALELSRDPNYRNKPSSIAVALGQKRENIRALLLRSSEINVDIAGDHPKNGPGIE